MQREWSELEEFPKYQVSSLGEFVNTRTDREVRPSRNQMGHAKITLVADGKQYTRSVAQLVAETFVEKPEPHYDTPIHLDGDLMNCEAVNLMWRPRWFAIKYHRQFQLEAFYEGSTKLYEIETDTYYDSVRHACMVNGLYYYDVIKSFVEETFVPITYQEFRVVK